MSEGSLKEVTDAIHVSLQVIVQSRKLAVAGGLAKHRMRLKMPHISWISTQADPRLKSKPFVLYLDVLAQDVLLEQWVFSLDGEPSSRDKFRVAVLTRIRVLYALVRLLPAFAAARMCDLSFEISSERSSRSFSRITSRKVLEPIDSAYGKLEMSVSYLDSLYEIRASAMNAAPKDPILEFKENFFGDTRHPSLGESLIPSLGESKYRVSAAIPIPELPVEIFREKTSGSLPLVEPMPTPPQSSSISSSFSPMIPRNSFLGAPPSYGSLEGHVITRDIQDVFDEATEERQDIEEEGLLVDFSQIRGKGLRVPSLPRLKSQPRRVESLTCVLDRLQAFEKAL